MGEHLDQPSAELKTSLSEEFGIVEKDLQKVLGKQKSHGETSRQCNFGINAALKTFLTGLDEPYMLIRHPKYLSRSN